MYLSDWWNGSTFAVEFTTEQVPCFNYKQLQTVKTYETVIFMYAGMHSVANGAFGILFFGVGNSYG